MPEGRQRQRHGVTKNLLECLAGAIVGAAAVLFLTGLRSQPAAHATADRAAAAAAGDEPPAGRGPKRAPSTSKRARPRTEEPKR